MEAGGVCCADEGWLATQDRRRTPRRRFEGTARAARDQLTVGESYDGDAAAANRGAMSRWSLVEHPSRALGLSQRTRPRWDYGHAALLANLEQAKPRHQRPRLLVFGLTPAEENAPLKLGSLVPAGPGPLVFFPTLLKASCSRCYCHRSQQYATCSFLLILRLRHSRGIFLALRHPAIHRLPGHLRMLMQHRPPLPSAPYHLAWARVRCASPRSQSISCCGLRVLTQQPYIPRPASHHGALSKGLAKVPAKPQQPRCGPRRQSFRVAGAARQVHHDVPHTPVALDAGPLRGVDARCHRRDWLPSHCDREQE